MVTPVFPKLLPNYVDGNWYQLDKALDEDAILNELEKEHEDAINDIVQKDSGIIFGNRPDNFEEEEEEDDDNNDDEESVIESEDDDEDDDEDMGMDEAWVPPSPVFNAGHI